MRIGLDIDGVMYMWQKTACYMMREVLPSGRYRDKKSLNEANWSGWDWLKEQVSSKDWEWFWNEGVKLGLFRYGHSYPGTIQAIRHLTKKHEVVLITHRPQKAVPDTLAWLTLLNLPIAGLHLLTGGEPKSEVRPMCDVYLDDKPDNIVDLSENTDAAAVVLMRRPWNAMYQPDDAGILIANDWKDFIRIVESL